VSDLWLDLILRVFPNIHDFMILFYEKYFTFKLLLRVSTTPVEQLKNFSVGDILEATQGSSHYL